jgi:hypothetical protein
LTAATIAAAPVEARAQEVVVEKTTSQATGPSMAMVGSGLAIFGLSYLPVAVVGASSGLEADRALFVPLAGPWIDLTQRPGCPQAGSCNAEVTAKILLVTDGVLQAVGALTIVGGLLTTAHETRTVRSASGVTVRLAPGKLSGGGYGVLALGEF